MAAIESPRKLSSAYDLSRFACGEPALDEWLRRCALFNEATGSSRTYVALVGQRVVGYYVLANGAITHAEAPGQIKRNMPDPVPVMVLGRLAVDREFQGRGIGTGLLRDAVLRTVQAAEIAGIRAILVHALSETAKGFYVQHGFAVSPVDPLTLLITVAEAKRMLSE